MIIFELSCPIVASWIRGLIFDIFTCYDDDGVLMVVVMVRYDNFRAFTSKCDQLVFRGLIFNIFTCYDDGGVLMVVVMVPYDNFRAFMSKCDQVDSKSDI